MKRAKKRVANCPAAPSKKESKRTLCHLCVLLNTYIDGWSKSSTSRETPILIPFPAFQTLKMTANKTKQENNVIHDQPTYRTAVDPEQLHEVIPPRDAPGPGSRGNHSPCSCRILFSSTYPASHTHTHTGNGDGSGDWRGDGNKNGKRRERGK